MNQMERPSFETVERDMPPHSAEKVPLEPIAEHTEHNSEAFLDRIDFGLLRDIFERISDTSRVPLEERNFLDPSRISVVEETDPTRTAEYKLRENRIVIRTNDVEREAEQAGVSPDLYFLKVLCHEEVHATSKRECEVKLSNGKTIASSRVIGGYMQQKQRDNETLFQLFNEGVTEKLSREVLAAYCKSAGKNDKELKEFFATRPVETPYGTAVLFVDALVKKISDATQVQESAVWDAIVRGQRQGENLMNKEFQDFFREVGGADFLRKLADADSEQNLMRLLNQPDTSREGYFTVLMKRIRMLSAGGAKNKQ